MIDINSPEEEKGYGPCGFVTILGRPNVGKSTFLNHVLGYKLTAVSHVPHTTRRKWLGIYSDDHCQIIFSDTPGIHESKNRMDQFMERTITSTLDRNDFTILLCDPTRAFGEEDELAARAALKSEKKTILVINKIDAANLQNIEKMTKQFLEILGDDMPVHKISALKGDGTAELLELLKAELPKSTFLYPKDQVADAFVRDIAEDIIRESCLECMREEIPHSLAVLIDVWDERDKKIKIECTIYVERVSQRRIIIGHEGKVLEGIRKSARVKLGKDLGKFVDLRVFVKVMPNWQNKINFLKELKLNDFV